MRRLPQPSTITTCPGCTTVVESICSTSAGPANTGQSAKPSTSSKNTGRRAPGFAKRRWCSAWKCRVTSAPTPLHQRLSKRLQRQLEAYFESQGLAGVFNAPIDLILGEHDIVQPDLLVVALDPRARSRGEDAAVRRARHPPLLDPRSGHRAPLVPSSRRRRLPRCRRSLSARSAPPSRLAGARDRSGRALALVSAPTRSHHAKRSGSSGPRSSSGFSPAMICATTLPVTGPSDSPIIA